MNRSVDSSKSNKKHKPEVNLDPDTSSSDLPDSSSSDSRAKKKKSKKKKKRRKYQKDDSSDLIRPMTVITDVNDAKIRNTGKRIR